MSAAFGMRGAGNSPVTAVTTASAVAGSKMVEMIVVDSGMVTDISSGPALASESKADSPAKTAGRLEFLYDRSSRARRFGLAGSRT